MAETKDQILEYITNAKENKLSLFKKDVKLLLQHYNSELERLSDNHRLLKKSALENFFQDEVAPDLEGVTDFEEAFAIMENAKTIYEALQNLDENEQLLLYEGRVEDTYPITAMELSYDTEMYAVALCE